ncbi:MAG: hypothetical protein WAN82_03155 [Candidatus Bathyarchaeia archaeon]
MVTMRVNRWLLSVLLLLILLEAVGILFWNTFAGAVALFALLFSLVFLGWFAISYLGSSFSASINPWVSDVRDMEGPCFNPMYMTWLFENHRLGWALWTTFVSGLLTPLSGLLVFEIATSGHFPQWDFGASAGGFIVGCAFLAFLAVCWVKGFCEIVWPETDISVPESVVEEWRDKSL